MASVSWSDLHLSTDNVPRDIVIINLIALSFVLPNKEATRDNLEAALPLI